MAEETQRPATTVPKAMVWSMIASYSAGYIVSVLCTFSRQVIVLLLFAVPPEDFELIATSGFPFGYILAQAINLKGAIGICILMILTIEIQLLAQIQATSRFVFSLARDNAMPFSAQVRRTSATKVPVVAQWVTIGLCAPFSLLVVANGETLHTVLAIAAGSLTFWAYVSGATPFS